MSGVRSLRKNHASRLLGLVHERGMVRARDVAAAGIPPEYLRILTRRGLLQQVSRGVYTATDAPLGSHFSLALAARRVPDGVVCLLSSLRLHGLTTQNPFEVWIGIGVKAHRPRLDYPTLRVVRFSETARQVGVDVYTVDGVDLRATTPARTVVDCFRYRNKVGLDVALEALRDHLRVGRIATHQVTPQPPSRDELWRLAKTFRMTNVMRPYLEALS